MDDLQKREQERSVLRWGGLSGLLGGILFILAMVVVGVLVPAEPTDLAGWVVRFPDVQAARVVENVVYLVALILEVPFFLAMCWALRKRSLAAGLFGSALGILGLAAMAISATPHVAHATLSDLYASGATAGDLATLGILFQAIRGIFDAMLYVGFLVVPLGIITLAVGMFRAPAFGKVICWASLVLGVVALLAAILQLIEPTSPVGAISYLAGIVFYLVLGGKVYSLSRAS